MRNNIIYVSFCLALLACIFQSSSGGRANAAGAGNTGAPGDSGPTCITCHGTNAGIQVALNIEATDAFGNLVTDYAPDSIYTLKVTINATEGSPSAYGFQMVSLNAEEGVNGADVSTWLNPSDNANITTLSSSGRTYIEHKNPSSTNIFTTEWKAPTEGSQVVTFYACGNGVNLNGATSGDNAACATLVLNENVLSHTKELINQMPVSLAPNPAREFIQLLSNHTNNDTYRIQIYTIDGRLLKEQSGLFSVGEHRTRLDVSTLTKGIYVVRVGNGKESASRKFVKI